MHECTRWARRRAARLGLALAGAALAACASPRPIDEFGWEETAAEKSAPTGGESLAQRKFEMRRAQRDLVAFAETLDSMQSRRDYEGYTLFSGFLDAYLGIYLDPLLEREGQSSHPELMALDANLRLVKAQVLVQLRDTGRAEDAIRDLEERYRGRENMLVDYPIGTQGTLGDALKRLRDRKWSG
jgi:hypothetical protein